MYLTAKVAFNRLSVPQKAKENKKGGLKRQKKSISRHDDYFFITFAA